MSRPRKPYGTSQPGRLPATMMKVLAAEMSDPSRLRRGKQYARDGSVLDIAIEPRIVTGEIQGSRPTPYVATIEVTTGDGMPLRRDVSTHCTCPDDDNWDGYACKHVVAAMFAFSDELLIEPELLDLWRGRDQPPGPPPADAAADTTPAAAADRASRHLRLVRPGERPGGTAPEHRPTDEPPVDPLTAELTLAAGTDLPAVPELTPVETPSPRDPQLAAVLRDALAAARVVWD